MAYERTYRPTVQSMLGKFKALQASYRCPDCVKSRSRPRQDELELATSGTVTCCAERVMGLLAATMSFDQATDTFEVLTGLTGVNARWIERVAKQLGDQVAKAAMTIARPPQPVDIMYMEIDVTGVPMRPEALAGRVGKAADGSAKTREVKMIATWEDTAAVPHYDAGVEPVTNRSGEPSFTERYRRHTQRSGFDDAHRQV